MRLVAVHAISLFVILLTLLGAQIFASFLIKTFPSESGVCACVQTPCCPCTVTCNPCPSYACFLKILPFSFIMIQFSFFLSGFVPGLALAVPRSSLAAPVTAMYALVLPYCTLAHRFCAVRCRLSCRLVLHQPLCTRLFVCSFARLLVCASVCSNGCAQDCGSLTYYQCATSVSCPGACTGCFSGYWGASCQNTCPSCVHGACCTVAFSALSISLVVAADGITGSGQCVCAAGWAQPLCATCAPGFFGPNCGKTDLLLCVSSSRLNSSCLNRLHQRDVQQQRRVHLVRLVWLQQGLRGRSVRAVRRRLVRLPELRTYVCICSFVYSALGLWLMLCCWCSQAAIVAAWRVIR